MTSTPIGPLYQFWYKDGSIYQFWYNEILMYQNWCNNSFFYSLVMFQGSENPATKVKRSEIPGNHFKNTIPCDLSVQLSSPNEDPLHQACSLVQQNLDNQSLVKCRRVSKIWQNVIDQQKTLFALSIETDY